MCWKSGVNDSIITQLLKDVTSKDTYRKSNTNMNHTHTVDKSTMLKTQKLNYKINVV